MTDCYGKMLLDTMIKKATFVKKGNYDYFITPLTNALPHLSPVVLAEIARGMWSIIPEEVEYNKVVAIETMGIPLGIKIADINNTPLNFIRKTPYHIPGEVEYIQQTYYKTKKLYVNGLTSNDRVLIVDDVIDSGGTMCETINNLPKTGATIAAVIVAIERDGGINKLFHALGKESLPFPVLALSQFNTGQTV